MLTLFCTVEGRGRTATGGRRYGLHPTEQQVVTYEAGGSGFDVARTSVVVYDSEASEDALRNRDLSPSEIWEEENSIVEVILGSAGALHISIFVRSHAEMILLGDLDEALRNQHLLAAVHLDNQFQSDDQILLAKWLEGERFQTDHIFWGRGLSSSGLVRQR